jgi:hypothetical protein
VAIEPDPQQHPIDAPILYYGLLIPIAFFRWNCGKAIRDVDILPGDIDMPEKQIMHAEPDARWVIMLYAHILVDIEGYNKGKI